MQIDWNLIALIFIINVTYVTLNTIRFMLTMKGYTLIAPFISMLEITIYVLGLGMVLNHLDNPFNVAAYALGYGAGIAIGIKIEEFLALGYIMVTVIIPNPQNIMPQALRDAGFGVTVSHAQGLEGERMVLEILSSRKNEAHLYKKINEINPKAFVISYEPKYISGGFWTKRIKGR